MYEDLAWNNFCKTGNIESFLEYKKLSEMNNKDIEILENEGIILDELDKGKWNSN